MNVIKRDVYILTDKLKQPIDYLQGTNAIPIEFTFRDFSIPSGAEARVYVEKPSGKGVYEQAAIVGNAVTVTVAAQMVAEVGTSTMQIEIVDGGKIMATFVQPLNVKETAIPIDSQSGSGFIEDLLQDVREATDHANEVSDTIEQKAQNGDFSATVNAGVTETGIPGTAAAVVNVGTAKDAVLNFTVPAGAKGDSGIMAPTQGYFALWVDSETGNLYCDYVDTETPPQFDFEDNGDLYLVIPDKTGGTV